MVSENFRNGISIMDNDILIDIEVSPNSNKFEITGFNSWRNRFEVRIKQVPQKGKANKELAKEFSKIFNCDVSIFKGEKSSQKTLLLKNITFDDVFNKLKSIFDN